MIQMDSIFVPLTVRVIRIVLAMVAVVMVTVVSVNALV